MSLRMPLVPRELTIKFSLTLSSGTTFHRQKNMLFNGILNHIHTHTHTHNKQYLT
jgi:hypothetical protein